MRGVQPSSITTASQLILSAKQKLSISGGMFNEDPGGTLSGDGEPTLVPWFAEALEVPLLTRDGGMARSARRLVEVILVG